MTSHLCPAGGAQAESSNAQHCLALMIGWSSTIPWSTSMGCCSKALRWSILIWCQRSGLVGRCCSKARHWGGASKRVKSCDGAHCKVLLEVGRGLQTSTGGRLQPLAQRSNPGQALANCALRRAPAAVCKPSLSSLQDAVSSSARWSSGLAAAVGRRRGRSGALASAAVPRTTAAARPRAAACA